jgi:hypothetical protein
MKKTIIFLTVSLITACGNKANTELSAPAVKQTSKQSVQQFQSPGKTHAAIEIDYQFSDTPRVGQPLEVSYLLRNAREEQDVSATLEFAGEVIASPQQQGFFKAKTNSTQIVSITPDREGMHYIKVFTSSVINGKKIHKAFNIPVQVGTVDWQQELQPEGELVESSEGIKLIVLPAE